jgi:hypothetical protein
MMFTLAEVAARYRVTDRFIREQVYQGQLKAIKAGQGRNAPLRFTEEFLAEWEKQQTVNAAGATS